jgi:hypothetical protein
MASPWIAATVFGLLVIGAPCAAHAGEAQGLLWIDDQGARRTRIELQALQSSAGILDPCASIDGRCVVAVRPGEYRVAVPSSRRIPSASRELVVGPGDRLRVVVAPGSKLQRELGTYTIVLGGLATVIGAVGYAFAFTARAGENRTPVAEGILFWGGGALLGAGIVIEETGKTRIRFVPLGS